jgi:hypothetical protein
VSTATVSGRGTRPVDTSARSADFYLATSGDKIVATRGDFLMATDIRSTICGFGGISGRVASTPA